MGSLYSFTYYRPRKRPSNSFFTTPERQPPPRFLVPYHQQQTILCFSTSPTRRRPPPPRFLVSYRQQPNAISATSPPPRHGPERQPPLASFLFPGTVFFHAAQVLHTNASPLRLSNWYFATPTTAMTAHEAKSSKTFRLHSSLHLQLG